MLSVVPQRLRHSPASIRGRFENELAHAQKYHYIQTQRLYQLSKTRPREFTSMEKRELKHRWKYGETRLETYQRLLDSFQQGLLNRGQWEKFKHALGMTEGWDDYDAYKKYTRQGLGTLTDEEFKGTNKFAQFKFDVPTLHAYQKAKEFGIGFLAETELNELNKMEQIQISHEEWQLAVDTQKALEEGVIRQTNGRLELARELGELTVGEYELISRIGFNIPRRTYEHKRNIHAAMQMGLIQERNGSLWIKKDVRYLTDRERRILRGIGFQI